MNAPKRNTEVGTQAAAVVCGNKPEEPLARVFFWPDSQWIAFFAGGTAGPNINSAILPVSPAKAFKTGRCLDKITLLIGVARDEFNGELYTRLVANTAAHPGIVFTS